MMKRTIILFSYIFIVVLGMVADVMPGDTVKATYKLHGQTRRFKFVYEQNEKGGLTLHWSIVRNLKLWTGSYVMSGTGVRSGNAQSYIMPEDGNYVILPDNETFAIISQSALKDLKKSGSLTYNGVKYLKTGMSVSPLGKIIEVSDPDEGGKMAILDNMRLPLIVRMSDNPLEINWQMTR